MENELSDENLGEQEVTVEVIPDSIIDIKYLHDTEALDSDEERDDENSTEYEIGSVDPALINRDLMLDQTDTYVLLSSGELLSSKVIVEEVEEGDIVVPQSEDEYSLEEQFDCVKCNFKTNNFKTLQDHNFHHHNVCSVCRRNFLNSSTLASHVRNDHSEFMCNTCMTICVGYKSYLVHARTHEEKRYTCYTCSEGFASGEKLMNHMQMHGAVLLYACNKCDAAFSSTQEVSIHLRNVHSNRQNINRSVVKTEKVCDSELDESGQLST